ncbi:hypothetical protein [uncultured Bacteroides sp.]|jgi:hypothetical protein|uniref:hypothetical protein n=1 Tax=uncultured Bacteroides sp. TaxID=162156 RepID=UPI00259020B3|nr:hypothetical protein [uncultured Bacteroides sp.]
MKKLKKLTLVKDFVYYLNDNEQKNIIGGQMPTDATGCLKQECIGTYNFCETDDYGDTLKDCGTGAVYCITEGCFFETNAFACDTY